MKNKILINVYVPTLDEEYEIYIPTNESIKVVLELIKKIIIDISDSDFEDTNEHFLLDMETLNIYEDNEIVRDTNLKNSKKILLV